VLSLVAAVSAFRLAIYANHSFLTPK